MTRCGRRPYVICKIQTLQIFNDIAVGAESAPIDTRFEYSMKNYIHLYIYVNRVDKTLGFKFIITHVNTFSHRFMSIESAG